MKTIRVYLERFFSALISQIRGLYISPVFLKILKIGLLNQLNLVIFFSTRSLESGRKTFYML